jgi:hypothetical protein
MRRRRLLLGAGTVWLVLLAGTYAALGPLAPAGPIGPEGAARITEG